MKILFKVSEKMFVDLFCIGSLAGLLVYWLYLIKF